MEVCRFFLLFAPLLSWRAAHIPSREREAVNNTPYNRRYHTPAPSRDTLMERICRIWCSRMYLVPEHFLRCFLC